MNIDEDDLSDEYDFMDEDDDAQQRRLEAKQQSRLPQYKYKKMMQQLADRTIEEFCVDLDDLSSVRPNIPQTVALRT
jgi:DNA replication licensing factor MCM7